MNGARSPQPRSPYRRRRILWSLFLLTAFALFYLSTHTDTSQYLSGWSLPSYLKDIDRSGSSSRAGLVADAKAKPQPQTVSISEIDELLHFVTQLPKQRLYEDNGGIVVEGEGAVYVNPDEPLSPRTYAPDGDEDWVKHLEVLRKDYPLVIFSKSYCPYSNRAKALLLETYQLTPAPYVVELDLRSDGGLIQTILGRLTARKTVPNIIVQGKSIGGSDDIHEMQEEGILRGILEDGGLQVSLNA